MKLFKSKSEKESVENLIRDFFQFRRVRPKSWD